jgi:hypothetical protein
LRNLRKLSRSGIVQKVIRHYRSSKDKPIEVPIPHGNSSDAYELLTSVAAQQWRKRVSAINQTPKGYTRSPKLGAKNLAFAKGCDPIEPSTYFSRERDNITIGPGGAELIVSYAEDNIGLLPELSGLL